VKRYWREFGGVRRDLGGDRREIGERSEEIAGSRNETAGSDDQRKQGRQDSEGSFQEIRQDHA